MKISHFIIVLILAAFYVNANPQDQGDVDNANKLKNDWENAEGKFAFWGGNCNNDDDCGSVSRCEDDSPYSKGEQVFKTF